jgi:hypothetical protein
MVGATGDRSPRDITDALGFNPPYRVTAKPPPLAGRMLMTLRASLAVHFKKPCWQVSFKEAAKPISRVGKPARTVLNELNDAGLSDLTQVTSSHKAEPPAQVIDRWFPRLDQPASG